VELIEYTRLVRKWLWLILIAAFVAGGITFAIRRSQPSVYQAQTTIAIGSFIQSPNPNSSEIQTGVQLAQTYAELAKTYSVLQPAIEKLKVPLTYEELQKIVDVRILPQTSLLVLSVNYTDPVLAADIANEVAQQLILNSPTNLTLEQQSQIDLANDQIARLNEQLASERQELELVNLQLSGATDPAEIDRLTNQRNALIDRTNQASATIAQFSTTIANLQERTNSVDIVEPARAPTNPSGSSLVMTTLLGALVGMALVSGVILLIEYLDDTMRTTEEVAQSLGLPVLGGIVRFGKPKDSYQQRLISELPLMISMVSEGYRAVRTNLLFSAEHGRSKVYLVTSPGPEEGKSLTSANLAISMALTGLQVLLIDCDLRRPKLHEIFGLNNIVGLTTLLLASQDKNLDSLNMNGEMSVNFSQCLQKTNVPNLRVITSGFVPQNPTELLGSALMQYWMGIFKTSSNVDVILVDTPPCLMLSDSTVLAASSGADIVLVIDAGHTQRAAAVKAKEQFSQVGGKIKGVVLNGVNVRDEKYYGYGYGYGYSYYSQNPSERILSPEIKKNGERETE
jgi:succinoglycan biosynthesis transport protein ExoP